MTEYKNEVVSCMWVGVSRERGGGMPCVEGERTGSSRERGDTGSAGWSVQPLRTPEEQRPHGRRVRPWAQGGTAQGLTLRREGLWALPWRH